MKTKIGTLLCIVIALIAVKKPIFADVCIIIDQQKDVLAENDRKNAKNYLELIFRENGFKVSESCQEQFMVYHLKLGKAFTVIISGKTGTEKIRVDRIESLPDAYAQLAKAIINKKNNTKNAIIDRNNIIDRQANPKREKADGIFYGKIGYGVSTDGTNRFDGVAFGMGYRYELNSSGIDFSFLNFGLPRKDTDGYFYDVLRIQYLYFFDPISNYTYYGGIGLGYSGLSIYKDKTNEDAVYKGYGLSSTISIGFEMNRATTIRSFIQLDAIVPIYCLKDDKKKTYAPYISLSFGIGF